MTFHGTGTVNKKLYAFLLINALAFVVGIHIGLNTCMAISTSLVYAPNTIHIYEVNKSTTGKDFSKNIQITVISESPKRILFYNPVHWWVDWVNNQWESADLFRDCPISNCVASQNQSQFESSDAVIYKLQLLQSVPKRKKFNQVWIFAQFESPQLIHHGGIMKKYAKLVNWTMGYRRDADIHLSHSYFRTFEDIQNVTFDLDMKSKMAVAFISHCRASSGRDRYIKELKKHMPVDIYGSCGTKSCAQNQRFKDAWNMKNKTSTAHNKCFSILDTRYKFFLSFENSLCKDYITEKSLHMVLSHDIVPVVRSGGNHSLFHPPNSVINTKDFKNISELAKYLKFLDKNISEYQNYFEWRKFYYTEGILSEWNKAFCDICKRLHNPNCNWKVYEDIYKWVNTPNDINSCNRPNDLPHDELLSTPATAHVRNISSTVPVSHLYNETAEIYSKVLQNTSIK